MSSPAPAQELRIGYVNMKAVLDNAPQVITGRDKLDLEFRPRNDLIEQEEAQAEALEVRLQAGDLATEDRIRLERDLRDLRRGIERQREDLRDELSFRRTEEVQRLEDQINLAVQEIAESYGYDLVLSSPVVYASDALDITGLILQRLQEEHDADLLEQGLD
ncbi:MAG: OmpH family outer membrane protein [Pseudomonadota bacterium]